MDKDSSNVAHNLEEQRYLNLIKEILDNGIQKMDRTNVGTLSLFAPTPLKFDLSNDSFPLLTTKRVFLRGVIEELLWFLRGDTNSKNLSDKNVHIWDDNATREFLDKRNLQHRQVGDLGPVYGFQWRHFGAEYKDCFTDYTGLGIDQIEKVIDTIKNNPNDRRIILSAWNPTDLDKMALPPCHIFCQFYVTPSPDGIAPAKLSSQLYQRSCDIGLGVPFNIASYALLTIMIAHITGLEPHIFTHVMGDTHIYLNHIEPLKEQIKRIPRQFPTLKIQLPEGTKIEKIEDFKYEHFVIEGYQPYPKIDMQMAV